MEKDVLELIIDYKEDKTIFAVLKNKGLLQYRTFLNNQKFSIGDLYIGSVKKVSVPLNACFVNIGHDKDAFLHNSDFNPFFLYQKKWFNKLLHSKESPSSSFYDNLKPYEKESKISDFVKDSEKVLVQILKEPINSKGYRLKTNFTLPGRFIVLLPFNDFVSVSQKIKKQEEKTRLLRLAKSIKPKGFGIIVRTAGINKKSAELLADVEELMNMWKLLENNIKNNHSIGKVLGNLYRVHPQIREILKIDFKNIYVNDQLFYYDIKEYIEELGDNREYTIKYYKGKNSILEIFNINLQIKKYFGKFVKMDNAGYLVVESTEAMHVIDVNSGTEKRNSKNDPIESALKINLNAVKEVARQILLRDLGGIIVVDFIDMDNPDHRRKVYDLMINELKIDFAKYKIIPISEIGLMQITRERLRQQVEIDVTETNSNSAYNPNDILNVSSIDLVNEIFKYILKKADNRKFCTIILEVHPFVKSHLTVGFISPRFKFFINNLVWIEIKSNFTMNFTDFKVL